MPYTLSIPSTQLSSDAKPHTIYNLVISTPLRTSTIPKRYTDFVKLHDDLTHATGATPPAPLPSKSWFSRTINNPELTESRREGLEAYVTAIENFTDSKWRSSNVWREFLGFPPGPSGANSITSVAGVSTSTASAVPPMTAAAWLDLHSTLRQHLQDARTALARRDAATTASAQHEAGAAAKKSLIKAHVLVARLDDALKKTGDEGMGLGDGEVRRRRDLVARSRVEREALEGVLNAWVSRTKDDSGSAGATTDAKEHLFRPARSMAGAAGLSPPRRSGRILGAKAQETNRTRELDNGGVLMLQKQIMKDQDMDVEQLAQSVRRMKEMGIAINEELVEQTQLLDVLDQDVDRVGGKVNVARKRINKIK